MESKQKENHTTNLYSPPSEICGYITQVMTIAEKQGKQIALNKE